VSKVDNSLKTVDKFGITVVILTKTVDMLAKTVDKLADFFVGFLIY
jgi:hypothetical protein